MPLIEAALHESLNDRGLPHRHVPQEHYFVLSLRSQAAILERRVHTLRLNLIKSIMNLQNSFRTLC